jgi:hypothetical protein
LLSTANAGTTKETMAKAKTPDEGKKAQAETKEETSDATPESAADRPTQPISAEQIEAAKKKDLPDIEPPPPKGEPWPDATPEPMRPVAPAGDDPPPRQRTETMVMPTIGQFGAPPAMPRTTAPPPVSFGTVENPTHMPGPREIPGGNPEDPAPAPGRVPPGDSRSLRRENEFALVYRMGTFVISRFGLVGTRGQWRVVEYPTSSAAAHSYAKECSRFVSEGFSDYRD